MKNYIEIDITPIVTKLAKLLETEVFRGMGDLYVTMVETVEDVVGIEIDWDEPENIEFGNQVLSIAMGRAKPRTIN